MDGWMDRVVLEGTRNLSRVRGPKRLKVCSYTHVWNRIKILPRLLKYFLKFKAWKAMNRIKFVFRSELLSPNRDSSRKKRNITRIAK